MAATLSSMRQTGTTHFVRRHTPLHSLTLSAVEAWASEVFCALCNDFVYDADLDFTIFVESNNALAHMQRMTRAIIFQPLSAPLTLAPLGLPGPMQYSEWRPSKVDAATIAKFSRRPTIPSYQLGAPTTDPPDSLCFPSAQIKLSAKMRSHPVMQVFGACTTSETPVS